jgi:hypothetical protein
MREIYKKYQDFHAVYCYDMNHDITSLKKPHTSIPIPYLYKESLDETESHESRKRLCKIQTNTH